MFTFFNDHYALSCIYFISKANIDTIFCGSVTRGSMLIDVIANNSYYNRVHLIILKNVIQIYDSMIIFYFQFHAICEILSRTLFEFLNENKALLCYVTFFHPLPPPQEECTCSVVLSASVFHFTPTFSDCCSPPYLLGSGGEHNSWLSGTFSLCWAQCQGVSLHY